MYYTRLSNLEIYFLKSRTLAMGQWVWLEVSESGIRLLLWVNFLDFNQKLL